MINRRKAIIATQVLNGGTLKAIGKRHGITDERARQILKEVVRTVAPELSLSNPKLTRYQRTHRAPKMRLTPSLRAFDIAHSRELSRLIVMSAEPDPNNCWLGTEAVGRGKVDLTAKSISEQTHGVIWRMASMGEQIPYEAVVFASSVGEIDETDIEWANEKTGFGA